jgi:hypothetical protein
MYWPQVKKDGDNKNQMEEYLVSFIMQYYISIVSHNGNSRSKPGKRAVEDTT